MHSRVGRQRQASQNSGTVIAASGGRVVARAVRRSRLFSLDFLSRAIFPGSRRPGRRQRRPAHGRIIGRIAPVPVGCARFFLTGARPRVPSSRLPQSAHSGALELRCSGFRPGSAASRRIFLPRALPRLPSRRFPFSLSAAPGRRWSPECRRSTSSRRRRPNRSRGVFPLWTRCASIFLQSSAALVLPARSCRGAMLSPRVARERCCAGHLPTSPHPSNLLCSEAGRRRARQWSVLTRRPCSRRGGGRRGTPACPRRGRVPGIR